MAVAISLTASVEDTVDREDYTFGAQSTGTAAADRDVVVGVFWASGNARSLTSATIDGGAATIDVQQPSDGAGISSGVAIIRRRVTTGTTADIVLTFSGGLLARCAIDVYRVTGADPDSPIADSGETQAVAATQSILLDIPADGVAIAAATINDTAGGVGTVTWTGLTEETNRTVENTTTVATSAHDEFATTQSGLSVQVGAGGGGDNGLSLVGISFAPFIQAVGTAAGTSTAAAEAVALSFAIGAASGASTAQAVGAGIIGAVGTAAGTSTVSGVGFGGLRPAVGSAAGTSTAAAFAEILPITNTVGIQKPVNAVLAGQQRMTPGNPQGMSKALLKSIFRE